jgi:hypothetical protein
MKNPQNPADDGEAQGDEQVNGPENEGVDENDLEGFPHILVSPFKPKKVNQPCCLLTGWFWSPPPLIINWDFLSRLF